MGKNFNLQIPRGSRVKLSQLGDGTWTWEVSIWSKKIADGHDDTRDAAMKAIRSAMGTKLLKAAGTAAERAAIRQKLKTLAVKRSYAAAYFFEGFVRGLNLTALCEGAVTGEQARWEADEGSLTREPLPTHPLTKSPTQVMITLWECCEKLGWDGRAADRWARNFFGTWYSNPGATLEQAVEVYPLKKKKSEDEVDAA